MPRPLPLWVFLFSFLILFIDRGSAESLRFQTSGGEIRINLPAGLTEGYYRLERMDPATDGTWKPVARKRGEADWERMFPDPPEWADAAGSQVIQDRAEGSIVYFRLGQWDAARLSRAAQASRFLAQATFGSTRETIDGLVGNDLDYAGWIDAQISLAPTYHLTLWKALPPDLELGERNRKGYLWFAAAIQGPDQLRQRAAWALSQIFVVSEYGSKNPRAVEEWGNFYDIFVRHAFGNYRDLLQQITWNAKMGDYLTYKGNRKSNGVQLPDENYARELMQLFTIGLWHLNRDGTLQLDETGNPIPTYDNDAVMEHARVFTGFDYAARRPGDEDPNRTDPMRIVENRHDTGQKTLVDGTVLPAGNSASDDVHALLDRLFLHPNTAPFVAVRLIQRLVTSNPSPGYVDRVAAVFEDNGQGTRGDLAAVFRAILLDVEARDPHLLADDATGELREPLLLFTHLCRAFALDSLREDRILRIEGLEEEFSQFPYRSPSVFNFYQPEYQAPGPITARGLYSPEFQIFDDSTGIHAANVFHTLIHEGLVQPITRTNRPEGVLNFEFETALADDVDALLDHLNDLLTRGTLTAANRQIIRDALHEAEFDDPESRVKLAISLFTFLPEFSVLL